jgi:hypothetical protein
MSDIFSFSCDAHGGLGHIFMGNLYDDKFRFMAQPFETADER